jgi:hypothetical protein
MGRMEQPVAGNSCFGHRAVLKRATLAATGSCVHLALLRPRPPLFVRLRGHVHQRRHGQDVWSIPWITPPDNLHSLENSHIEFLLSDEPRLHNSFVVNSRTSVFTSPRHGRGLLAVADDCGMYVQFA